MNIVLELVTGKPQGIKYDLAKLTTIACGTVDHIIEWKGSKFLGITL